jgi:hypothetical protein
VETIDYNGQGRWSAAEITSRYKKYAAEAGITPLDMSAEVITDRKFRRVYPVMTKIIEGIKSNDPACIRIGIEFIEEDQSFPFGRSLKSDTARALRSAQLTPDQGQRILQRVFDMLERGYIPHEYRYYARLARNIGYKEKDLPLIDRKRAYVVRWYKYFQSKALS